MSPHRVATIAEQLAALSERDGDIVAALISHLRSVDDLAVPVERPALRKRVITIPPAPPVVVTLDELDEKFDHGGEQ